MTDSVLNTTAAAEELEITRDGVIYHVRKGHLKPINPNSNSFDFWRSDVEALKEQRAKKKALTPNSTVSTSPADGAGQALADTTSGGQ